MNQERIYDLSILFKKAVGIQFKVPEQVQMILVQMQETAIAGPTTTGKSHSRLKITNLKSYPSSQIK